ncbi:hypothetical protein AMD27_17745 (plasmid) [Acinetobacter sp. TGL-Y2]|uniref:ParA family protein n=1 Tax=Acinetobacter sp. TGL-Y2 TaxID=1407071 RepID=UPI0007A64F3A|nr:ParA family protein [Acinetobacter sp. TGL-Y2]AMW80760.1 hypothetical protein AMD27_17745 [Acinetobacter sp. TGL-Y2]
MSNENKTRIVLFISQKGGAGKTVNIVNLATVSYYEGTKGIAILDCDTQKSALKWSDTFRTDKLRKIEAFFPMVVGPSNDGSIQDTIDYLAEYSNEIWVDTAGYIGDDATNAKRILEEVIPLADLIVIPCKASRSDVCSTVDTIRFVEDILSVNGKSDTPRCILGSDIRGNDKGYGYFLKLFSSDEQFKEYSAQWKMIKSYIPSAAQFVRNVDIGGTAFFPTRVKSVITASIGAYQEMMALLGIKNRNQSEAEIIEGLANLGKVRKKAMQETIEMHEDQEDQSE